MMESEMLYAGLRWPLAIIGLGQNYGLEHFSGSGRQNKRSCNPERTPSRTLTTFGQPLLGTEFLFAFFALPSLERIHIPPGKKDKLISTQIASC